MLQEKLLDSEERKKNFRD